jgi:hypothetical protein
MEETTQGLDLHNQPVVSAEASHKSLAETLAEDCTAPVKPLTELQFRQLRRAYFTVRHDTVATCGHKIDRLNEPKNNCEYCWWAFFGSHGELVQTADKAFQEQGQNFLDKMRGQKFRKMFLRYMSTLARFQKEQELNNKRAESERLNERSDSTPNDDQSGEMEAAGLSGNGIGQDLRIEDILPHGQTGRHENPVNPDEFIFG